MRQQEVPYSRCQDSRRTRLHPRVGLPCTPVVDSAAEPSVASDEQRHSDTGQVKTVAVAAARKCMFGLCATDLIRRGRTEHAHGSCNNRVDAG